MLNSQSQTENKRTKTRVSYVQALVSYEENHTTTRRVWSSRMTQAYNLPVHFLRWLRWLCVPLPPNPLFKMPTHHFSGSPHHAHSTLRPAWWLASPKVILYSTSKVQTFNQTQWGSQVSSPKDPLNPLKLEPRPWDTLMIMGFAKLPRTTGLEEGAKAPMTLSSNPKSPNCSTLTNIRKERSLTRDFNKDIWYLIKTNIQKGNRPGIFS